MANTPELELREITKDNLGSVLRLKVAPEQEHFVASNAVSIAQAHYADDAWFRGAFVGDTPVGFVMLSLEPDKSEYWVWRLMVGADHQRQGHGRAILRAAIEHVRGLPGAKELLLSHVPGEGNPSPLYLSMGFAYTGEEDDGELVMRLALD